LEGVYVIHLFERDILGRDVRQVCVVHLTLNILNDRATDVDVRELGVRERNVSSMLSDVDQRIHSIENVSHFGLLKHQSIGGEFILISVAVVNRFKHCSQFSILAIVCQLHLIKVLLALFVFSWVRIDEILVLDLAANPFLRET
jgi:hypothetical protein